MAIQRRALDRYLRGSLLPLFGGPWRVYDGECILRVEGLLIQGVWMYRSSYDDKFRPAYSINVLPEPCDILHGTLGSHLKNDRGGDMWIRWEPDREGFTEELMQAIRDQTKPRINEPLTLDAVHRYITQYHLKHRHFAALWSLGIIRGLEGNLQEANDHLEAVERDFRNGVRNWEARGKPAPSWMHENVDRVAALKNHLTDRAAFVAYCDREGAQIKKALKIPD